MLCCTSSQLKDAATTEDVNVLGEVRRSEFTSLFIPAADFLTITFSNLNANLR